MYPMPPEGPPRFTYDSKPEFIEAVSICAELESRCLHENADVMQPYVGMARCALTEYGSREPGFYRLVHLASVNEGLDRLEELLTFLIREADELGFVLRLHEAREIIREGRLRSG
jgi:hypothetical protein